jgi:hypothetical protein
LHPARAGLRLGAPVNSGDRKDILALAPPPRKRHDVAARRVLKGGRGADERFSVFGLAKVRADYAH